jgi:hypothetical protein
VCLDVQLRAPASGLLNRVASNDTRLWKIEAWQWILRQALGLPDFQPSWFILPAIMRFTISTPEVLKVLQLRQKGLRELRGYSIRTVAMRAQLSDQTVKAARRGNRIRKSTAAKLKKALQG